MKKFVILEREEGGRKSSSQHIGMERGLTRHLICSSDKVYNYIWSVVRPISVMERGGDGVIFSLNYVSFSLPRLKITFDIYNDNTGGLIKALNMSVVFLPFTSHIALVDLKFHIVSVQIVKIVKVVNSEFHDKWWLIHQKFE